MRAPRRSNHRAWVGEFDLCTCAAITVTNLRQRGLKTELCPHREGRAGAVWVNTMSAGSIGTYDDSYQWLAWHVAALN